MLAGLKSILPCMYNDALPKCNRHGASVPLHCGHCLWCADRCCTLARQLLLLLLLLLAYKHVCMSDLRVLLRVLLLYKVIKLP